MEKLIQTLLESNMGMGSKSYTFRLLSLEEDKNYNPSKDTRVKSMLFDFGKDIREVKIDPKIIMNHHSLPYEDRNWGHIVVLIFLYENLTRKDKSIVKEDLKKIKNKYYEKYAIKQKRRFLFWNRGHR